MIFVVIFAGRIGEKSERRKHPDRRAERLPVGVRSRRRRVRDAAEQGLGLDRAAALPRDQRRRDRRRSGSRSRRGSSRSGSCCSCCSSARQRQLVADGTRAARARRPAVDRAAAQRAERAGGAVRDHAGLFFMMPVYLQMTLGLDALADRHPDLPAVDLADPLLGRRHPPVDALVAAPDRASSRSGSSSRARCCCSAAVDPELSGWLFGIGMFTRRRGARACSPRSSAT